MDSNDFILDNSSSAFAGFLRKSFAPQWKEFSMSMALPEAVSIRIGSSTRNISP